MKKIMLGITAMMLASSSYAQNTPWSTTGNIGIGITNPTSLLHVVGSNNGAYAGNTATFSSNIGNGSYTGNQINITNAANWGLLLGFDGPGVSSTGFHAPNAGYIINVNNAPLNLGANNLVNMTLVGNGNVGIGTRSPATPLDIRFPYSKTDNASIRYSLSLGSNDASNPSVLNFVHTGGTSQSLRHWEIQTSEQGIVDAGNLNLQAYGGNVGIGTTSPSDLLMINAGAHRKGITIGSDGDAAAYTDFTMAINTSVSVPAGKPLGWDVSHRKDGYFSGTPAGNSSLEFYAYLQGGAYYAPLCFRPDGNVILVSNKNALGGNVLIGKTTQNNTNYKLDVNGSVRANEVVINTTGADFVFDEHYSLPKLSEVKTYINHNHHLPEIPSAAQMKRKGLGISEINTKLLQKVEELTLYTIQQKEYSENLKEENKKLKKEQQKINQAQEARMAALEKALLKLTKNKIQ